VQGYSSKATFSWCMIAGASMQEAALLSRQAKHVAGISHLGVDKVCDGVLDDIQSCPPNWISRPIIGMMHESAGGDLKSDPV
jgi:hypothetical protein